jgi:LCP family protein required for cell wall assembly
MLLYLDAKTKHAFLLSIPRDLYVQVLDYGQVRASSIYGLGEQDTDTNGLALARQTISATLGLAIDYTALVRFDSFVTIIDTIGGVDVEVPYPIDDPDFPDDRGGSDPFSLPAGTQYLDGTTALRYARTRVTPADYFDRTFRQQQLALAVHDRVTRFDLLPDLIAQAPTIWTAVGGGLETDLSLSDVIDLALPAASLTNADITTAALNECCTVESTTSAGRRVLLPQSDEIEALIQDLLEKEQ